MSDVITQEQFVDYWSRNIGHFKCEVCGNDKFQLINDPSDEIVGLVAKKNNGPLQSVTLCPVYCNNCGNLKTFFQQFIVDWLKENPK